MTGNKTKMSLRAPLTLLLICLCVTLLLALTHNLTAPFIAEARERTASETRAGVCPQAGRFVEAEAPAIDGLDSVYLAYDGEEVCGTVFTARSKGFGGEMTVVCGLDDEGRLTGCRITRHSETPGLGTKVADEAYLAGYAGAGRDEAAAMDGVTGATFTSKGLKEALGICFDAWDAGRKEGLW